MKKLILIIIAIFAIFITTSARADTYWGKCSHLGYAHTEKGYEAYLDCDYDGIAELKCTYNFEDETMIERTCETTMFEPKFKIREVKK